MWVNCKWFQNGCNNNYTNDQSTDNTSSYDDNN